MKIVLNCSQRNVFPSTSVRGNTNLHQEQSYDFKKDKSSSMLLLHFYFPTIATNISEVNDHPVCISKLSFSIFVILLSIHNFKTLSMKIFYIEIVTGSTKKCRTKDQSLKDPQQKCPCLLLPPL